ncbi:polyphosphate synthetase [Schizosaccharomyces octosporus yFS286]|uniref:Polyphosphate synthetase n=1 Tax=Schizosaccharomyces octosporus (strain yFS286) TaxID=483514 RepID=S9PW33_SCHOY|nr:polyphosphate synthetase [Schizosaccharomyces octosporus yFS286]EPX73321.1 polyphosphate synthetase [Schizosaccharomyces octosporus yFS286]
MRFTDSLEAGIHQPWREHYMNYVKLKHFLKADEESPVWEENDESRFVSALDDQLEKVSVFHQKIWEDLNELLTGVETIYDSSNEFTDATLTNEARLKFLEQLDSCTDLVKRLEKYTRLNLTGFYKIVKKHDKLHSEYSLRPLLQVRLRACSFGNVQYNPILARIFSLYNPLRTSLSGDQFSSNPRRHNHSSDENVYRRRTYRFWVHPDNLMEVKTFIMRRLPVLYYSGKHGFDRDRSAVSGILDPISTCLYFDNPNFDLYTQNLERSERAFSLRLHWYGKLNPKTDIIVERMVREGSSLSHSEDRFVLREKKINEFLKEAYEPDEKKSRDDTTEASDSSRKKQLTEDVQKLIGEYNLQPVLRSVYTRTAFQIPGDDSVRVNLDSDWVMIREDSFDQERPCRDPVDWHRHDIDDADFPYKHLRKGEHFRFPYSVLEIRECLKPDEEEPLWISELRGSHLISEIDGFSKYEHGVAVLFERNVPLLPMWLFSMEQDIRKDPRSTYPISKDNSNSSNIYVKRRDETIFTDETPPKTSKKTPVVPRRAQASNAQMAAPQIQHFKHAHGDHFNIKSIPGLLKPSTYGSIYRPGKTYTTPPHIQKPEVPLRVSGPVKVETKVWLANERTYLNWLQVVVLFGSLSLALYNSAGEGIGRVFGSIYVLLAVLMGMYAWRLHAKRCHLIMTRSPVPMTEYWGPLLVGVALAISLIANMAFALRGAVQQNLIEDDHVLVQIFCKQFF